MNDTIIAHVLRLSEGGGQGLLAGIDPTQYEGALFSRLLNAGVLVEQAPASDWGVCDCCTCGLDWRMLDDEGAHYRARCPLDHTRDDIVSHHDLRSFVMDTEALARLLAGLANLSDRTARVVDGVWYLGRLSSRRGLVVCFEQSVMEDPNLPGFLRDLAHPFTTLLCPRQLPEVVRKFRTGGIDVTALEDALSSDANGNLALSRHLLDPLGDTRLIVESGSGRVFLDGTQQRVGAQPLRLLKMLMIAARNGEGSVPNFVIEREFSRDPKDLVRNLREALARGRGNSVEIKSWIAARRDKAAFDLVLAPEDIELRD